MRDLLKMSEGKDVRRLPKPGSKVWSPGTVVAKHTCTSPRTYLVDDGDRILRRNRKHLKLSSYLANTRTPEPEIDIDANEGAVN